MKYLIILIMLMGCGPTDSDRLFCLQKLVHVREDSKLNGLGLEAVLSSRHWCLDGERDPRTDKDTILKYRSDAAQSLCKRNMKLAKKAIQKEDTFSPLRLLFYRQKFCTGGWINNLEDSEFLTMIYKEI